MNNDIQQLQNMAAEFNQQTKSAFKSCAFAAMNVDQTGLIDMWGDFKSRKDAKEAARMWGVVAAKVGGNVSARVEGKCYRVVMSVN